MDVVEVARFTDLTEAQIAAGALRSAGFAAEVQDANLGTVDFLLQRAMGGFRLVTPAGEHAEASAFLAELQANAPPPLAEPSGSPERTAGAILLMLLFGWAGGFLAAKRGSRLPED